MRRVEVIGGMTLLAAMFLSGITLAAGAEEPSGGQCTVSVDRSSPADTFSVDRQVYNDGSCICYVRTGPETQSQNTEQSIADLQRRRECSDSPIAATAGEVSGRVGTGVYVGAALLGGIIAAVSGGGGDSTGG